MSFIRTSQFRHVFGKELPKESWYEGIQGAGVSAPDSNLVACNSKYFALAWWAFPCPPMFITAAAIFFHPLLDLLARDE